ncbi:MAG: hypothetical protein HND58_08260 [Planctomycetota bacterium]|nr:MAG: hypothetical protein HND58_08260 [Planctomycetota bacterium]
MTMPDLNAMPLPGLFDELAMLGQLDRFLALVREEDLGPELVDVTSELAVGATDTLRAEVRASPAWSPDSPPCRGSSGRSTPSQR